MRQSTGRAHGLLAPDSFFFSSPCRSFSTQGCYARLAGAAHDGGSLHSSFQLEVRQTLAAARKAGIARPLIVGAIPFDTRQPSALFVPKSWTPLPRQLAAASGEAAVPMPDVMVTAQRAIPGQRQFMTMVAQAVDATTRGDLKKVVLARLMEITTRTPLNAVFLLEPLIAQNPDSYHFHVPLPDGSFLLGASPELLLRKTGLQFSSLPLAGTARRQQDPQRDHEAGQALLRSVKDRYEHALVIAAMQQQLQPGSDVLILPEQPILIATPALWHLATPIDGAVSDPAENALSLACRLHPTPALSGFPHALAEQQIATLEPFSRQWFGGIVGWCDDDGNGEWVVTIRCGHIRGHRIRLFAGAGIVPDSSPEAEWQETTAKLNTMLRLFGGTTG